MQIKVKEFLKNKGIYIVAFGIPWLIVVLHSVIRNGWLVGGGSILRGDSGIQYYQLCVELWNKIHSGESLFYSWNAGGGFDFFLNFAYYLVSPFTILIVAVPKGWLENTVQSVMVLKWSCIAVTMTYYFMHTKFNQMKSHKKFVALTLGCVFALSNCILNFVAYFNWNDVIILFPLLLLEIERMLGDGHWKRYYCLLTLAILCNFYTAYQVCIFLLLWFIFVMNSDVKQKVRKFVVFITSSLLAAISGLVVIIPCVAGVANRYSVITEQDKRLYVSSIIVNVWKSISKLFAFDTVYNVTDLRPNLYISVGVASVLLLYLFTKIPKKEKIKTTILYFVVTGSIYIGALSYVWHGFSVPNAVYHRFLYLYVFLSCFICMQLIMHIQEVRLRSVVFALLLGCVLIVVGFFNVQQYQEFYTYLITILLFALYQIICVLQCRKSITNSQWITVLCILIMGELIANAVYIFSAYDVTNYKDKYYIKDTEKLVDGLQLADGERIEMAHCTRNMGLMESLPSDEIFASYCNGADVYLHVSLGQCFSTSAYEFCGGSPLLNLMFNIRYGTSMSEYNFSDVEKIGQQGDVTLYKTKRLAGLGYMTSDKVLDWQGNTLGPIEAQNQFVQYATGENAIFDIIYPEVTCNDIVSTLHPNDEYLNKGFYYYEYTACAPKGQEVTTLNFTIEEDMDLYMVSNSESLQQVGVMIDGEQTYFEPEQRQMQETLHIGKVKKGQKIIIYAAHDISVGEKNSMWYQFAKFNEDNYAKAYEKLSKNVYNIEQMDSTYVKGNITAEQDGIMMTSIQAMDGFAVYVDGEQIEYKKVADTMIGVPLKKGKHVVEFRYQTPYYVQGAIGSLIGIFIFVCICLYDKVRKKANNEKAGKAE